MKLPQWKTILTKYNVQKPNKIGIKQDRQQEKNQSKQLSYDDLIKEADHEFDKQHYYKAKNLYEQALKLNNVDTYAAKMIDRINNTGVSTQENNTEVKQLKEEEKQNTVKFNSAIAKGKLYYQKGDLENALKAYTEASILNPLAEEPQNQIALITKRLAENKDNTAIELQYNDQIILADNLLAYAGKVHTKVALEDAIKAYKDALNIKPSEIYPAKQIKYINSEITNMIVTKAKADSIYDRKLKDNIYQETLREFYGLPNTENNYQKQLDLLDKIVRMQKELGIPINRDLEKMADLRRGYLERKKQK
jgi:tetratricopeptide (TPR) repeat protein